MYILDVSVEIDADIGVVDDRAAGGSAHDRPALRASQDAAYSRPVVSL